MNNKLNVYTNDYDYFVARDLDDLRIVFEKHYGETMSEIGENINDWYVFDENNNLTIRVNKDDYNPEDITIPVTACRDSRDGFVYLKDTASIWANANGQGFLCSTEY